MVKKSLYLLFMFILLTSFSAWAAQSEPRRLFGYDQIQKQSLDMFPQWLLVLERHLINVKDSRACQSTRFNQCHLKQWQSFLQKIKSLPTIQQIKQVNQYANEKTYTLDIENYSLSDYWAAPKEFLMNSGDCEDYAIIKMLSMKWLGYDANTMRVVIVQDTNLKIPHAIMAIENKGDILILDNQIEEVISHTDVFHYVPVYSLNQKYWWMHIPSVEN